MRIGLYLIGAATGRPTAAPIADPAFLAPFARRAEDLGFDSLWFADHIVFPARRREPYPYAASGEYPWDNDEIQLPEPLSLLAFLAGCTTRLRSGTAVLVLPQRQPLLLAKQLATIDRLSGGRVELGVGSGWLRDEFEALGVPFDGRGTRTDEYVRALRVLWRERVASFDGTTVSFRDVRLTTHPVQPGGVPVIVGGHSPRALRRAGELGDGFLPATSIEDDPAAWPGMLDTVRTVAARAGRDPAAVALHGFGSTAAGAERLEELGAVRMIVSTWDADLPAATAHLERLAGDLAPWMPARPPGPPAACDPAPAT